jgi:hypothetical protein
MFHLFAMYVVFLGMGHTLLCKTIKADTIRRYVAAAAKQVQKRRQSSYTRTHPNVSLPWISPIRPHGDSQMATEITECLREIQRWENMKGRREPLTTDMIQFQKNICLPSTPHSVDQVMYDWEVCGIYAGFRLSEWAQEDHVCHRNLIRLTIDGQEPMAFVIGDLEVYGENRRRMSLSDALRRPYLVKSVDVKWRYQKNGTKNEKKTFVRVGVGGPTNLCAVSAWLRIVQRWVDLKLDKDHPLAVFTDSGLASGKPEFIRPTHISTVLFAARLRKCTTLRIRLNSHVSLLTLFGWAPAWLFMPLASSSRI